MKAWRPKDTIEPNPIGLSKETVTKLIPLLDQHTASLYVLFHQYQKHHWLVEGPQFHDLHLYLGASYDEVQKEVDAVAERITAIGGIPTCNPVEQAKIAYVTHEPEGTFHIRDMLKHDQAHESAIAIEFRKTIKLACDLGDYGTETLLKNILVEVEDRAHHLEHFLGEDSLEIGRANDK